MAVLFALAKRADGEHLAFRVGGRGKRHGENHSDTRIGCRASMIARSRPAFGDKSSASEIHYLQSALI